jgi:hypothetical protein
MRKFIISVTSTVINIIYYFIESSYQYTVEELTQELKNRITSSVESKAFTSDILAAVVCNHASDVIF